MPNGVLNSDKKIVSKKFGRWNVIVYRLERDGKLVASFLDLAQDKTKFPDGQFTGGCYYISTLLNDDGWGWDIRKGERGLALHGGVSAWTVDPASLKKIGNWLAQVQSGKIPAKRTAPKKTAPKRNVEYGIYLGAAGRKVADVPTEWWYKTLKEANAKKAELRKAFPNMLIEVRKMEFD